MKLQEISSKDALTQQVVARMIQYSTVLEFADFYPIVGNADYTRKAASATGGQFRALDSDYTTGPVNPAFANPTLKILGDKVKVDRAHERRGLDVASVRARELMSFAGNLGKQFQNYFFNGTGTDDQFSGLKLIVPSSQKLSSGTNGFQVVLGNSDTAKKSQQQFLELLDNLIQMVDGGAQVIFMNGAVLSRLSSVAREQIDYQKNEFGQPVPYYNGIPIRNAGFDKDGNLVLPFDETQGTSTDCTSIYAVRFGEAADLTLATNIGVEVKDLGLVGVHYTHAVEFDVDLVLLNDKSVARLTGIRLG